MSFVVGERVPSDTVFALIMLYLPQNMEIEIASNETKIRLARDEKRKIELRIPKIEESCLRVIPPAAVVKFIDQSWRYYEIQPIKGGIKLKLQSRKFDYIMEREVQFPIVFSTTRKLVYRIIHTYERWEINARSHKQ